MTFILWVVRVLVILLVIRFVVRLVSGAIVSSRSSKRTAPRPPERLGGTLVRDPQCGTYVSPSGAVTSGSGDSLRYFCSTTCRDAYRG